MRVCHQLTSYSKALQTHVDSSKHSSSHQQCLLLLQAQSGFVSFPDPAPASPPWHREPSLDTWGPSSSWPSGGETAKKQQSGCRAAGPVSCEVCSLVLQKCGRGRCFTGVLSTMEGVRKYCFKKGNQIYWGSSSEQDLPSLRDWKMPPGEYLLLQINLNLQN